MCNSGGHPCTLHSHMWLLLPRTVGRSFTVTVIYSRVTAFPKPSSTNSSCKHTPSDCHAVQCRMSLDWAGLVPLGAATGKSREPLSAMFGMREFVVFAMSLLKVENSTNTYSLAVRTGCLRSPLLWNTASDM